jgi:hypothetical protein
MFEGCAFIAAHAAGGGVESGETIFAAFRIEAADVMGDFHQLGRGKTLEVFEDGFQNAHGEEFNVFEGF